MLCDGPEEPIIFINAVLILSNKHWAYNRAPSRIRCAFLRDIWGQRREFHMCFSMMVNHQFWLTVRLGLLVSSSPDDTRWDTDNIVASNSHSGSQTLVSGRHSNIMQKASCMANGWFGRWADERGAFPRLVPPDLVCLHPRGNQSCQSAEIGLLRFRFCERKNGSKTSCLSCPRKELCGI